MNLIDWTAFSWDNFATLATGFLAIGGALWVGAKQVAILASQNEISQKNALDTKLIKQQELQIALLERRQECIKAMRALDLVWHQKNRFEPEDWSKLDSVLSEAQLIYPAPIASKLEKGQLYT